MRNERNDERQQSFRNKLIRKCQMHVEVDVENRDFDEGKQWPANTASRMRKNTTTYQLTRRSTAFISTHVSVVYEGPR